MEGCVIRLGTLRPVAPQLLLGRGCGRGCGVPLHLIGRRRSCGSRAVGPIHLLVRRRGRSGCGVGLLHLVMFVLGGGIGSLRRRRSRRVVRSGSRALRLSRRRILGGRRGAGLCGALCHYRQGQGEHDKGPQDDSK